MLLNAALPRHKMVQINSGATEKGLRYGCGELMRMKRGSFLGVNHHCILHCSAPLPTGVSLCDLPTGANRRIDFRFASRGLLSDLGNLLLKVALDP